MFKNPSEFPDVNILFKGCQGKACHSLPICKERLLLSSTYSKHLSAKMVLQGTLTILKLTKYCFGYEAPLVSFLQKSWLSPRSFWFLHLMLLKLIVVFHRSIRYKTAMWDNWRTAKAYQIACSVSTPCKETRKETPCPLAYI